MSFESRFINFYFPFWIMFLINVADKCCISIWKMLQRMLYTLLSIACVLAIATGIILLYIHVFNRNTEESAAVSSSERSCDEIARLNSWNDRSIANTIKTFLQFYKCKKRTLDYDEFQLSSQVISTRLICQKLCLSRGFPDGFLRIEKNKRSKEHRICDCSAIVTSNCTSIEISVNASHTSLESGDEQCNCPSLCRNAIIEMNHNYTFTHVRYFDLNIFHVNFTIGTLRYNSEGWHKNPREKCHQLCISECPKSELETCRKNCAENCFRYNSYYEMMCRKPNMQCEYNCYEQHIGECIADSDTKCTCYLPPDMALLHPNFIRAFSFGSVGTQVYFDAWTNNSTALQNLPDANANDR